MRIEVFDVNLRRKTVAFTWESLLWQPKYNDKGLFQIEFQQSSNIRGEVALGDYITFDADDSETVMIVNSIQFADGKVIISGTSAVWFILSKRVSTKVIANTNAAGAMYDLVSGMTVWKKLILPSSPDFIEGQYQAQTSDGSIWNYSDKIAKSTDLGIRIRKTGDYLMFECYKPPLNKAVRFAAELGTLGNEKYIESDLDYANVAIVAGSGQGNERISVVVGNTSAADSDWREIYVDARFAQQEEGESEEAYKTRLELIGLSALLEQIKAQSIYYDLSDENVSLGDVVTITPSYPQITVQARVTSISIKSQKNITTKQIGVGTPVLTHRKG